jgi:hypothetical protein
MSQFGGKDSKRHFTVVMGGKEHGLYVSSTPSSAAKKAVTKLCAANKSKKVQFEIREITQGSKKKTYGPYSGYIEKLKEPIELKGRVIRYKPVAKLSGKTSNKMVGGAFYLVVTCNTDEAQKKVFEIINKICDERNINRDDAIKIIINTNQLNDTVFKIEIINEYSLMPNLINLIQNRLDGIKGVSIEKKFDSRAWNINKKEFINVKNNRNLSKELRNKIVEYKRKKNLKTTLTYN